MWAALLELLPALVGEGGALEGLFGKQAADGLKDAGDVGKWLGHQKDQQQLDPFEMVKDLQNAQGMKQKPVPHPGGAGNAGNWPNMGGSKGGPPKNPWPNMGGSNPWPNMGGSSGGGSGGGSGDSHDSRGGGPTFPIPLPVFIVGPLPLPVSGGGSGGGGGPPPTPSSVPKTGLAGLFQKFEKFTNLLGTINYGLTLIKKWLFDVPVALAKWGITISESNRELAMWNAQIASSFMNLDFTRQQLDVERADATSGSAQSLNQSIGKLLQEVQPLTIALTTSMNLAARTVTRIVTQLIVVAKGILPKALLKLLEDIEKDLRDKPAIGPDNLAHEALRDITEMIPPGFPGFRGQQLPAGPREPLGPLR